MAVEGTLHPQDNDLEEDMVKLGEEVDTLNAMVGTRRRVEGKQSDRAAVGMVWGGKLLG